MQESRHRSRGRVRIAIIALLGTLLALVPAMPAQAAGEFIQVTSPSRAETWVAGTTKAITWGTDLTTGNVKVDLMQTDGTTVAGSITASTAAAAGKFNWQIPLTATAGAFKIRVQKTDDVAVTDVSNATVTLAAPVITPVAPKTGDVWVAGKVNPIRWTTNTTGNIKLDLYQGGGLVTPIRASIAASAKSFNWDVPVSVATASGGLFTVRATSLVNPAITADSQAFTINLPAIGVTAPALNDDWGTGTTQTIKWSLPSSGNVKVELITQPGSTATATLKASQAAKSGSLKWTIPHGQAIGDYTVRVTSLVNANLFDDSGVFQVVQGALTVTAPTSSDTWLAGTTKRITWTTAIGGSIKLDLVQGGSVVTPIRASVAATARSFTWTIPLNVATASGSYAVRATSLSNPLTFDNSDSFTLNLPTITAATPTDFDFGTSKAITWTTDIANGNVKVEAIKQPGSTATTTIKSSHVAKSGTVTWAVPATLPAGAYKIRVTALGNPLIFDDSGDFNVTTPTITASDPAGPWVAGSTQAVTWTSEIGGNVKLELITPEGVKSIRSSVAASAGTFNWAIPLNIATSTGQTVNVRVTSLANGAVLDNSNTFTLNLPTLNVTAPIAGTLSKASNPHTVTWNGSLATGNVKIELIHTGAVVSVIRSSVAASAGTFSWTIPSTVTNQGGYTVRITSLSNSNITHEGAAFTIGA